VLLLLHDETLIATLRRYCRLQNGNQNPYIEEEQTTQWPNEKEQKGQKTMDKTCT
jgi:hypothetical protein